MSKVRLQPNVFLTLGGRIKCVQCQAKSKRTGQQCRAPAKKGKNVCKNHGAFSVGPTTTEGRQRCAQAKTVHGDETTAKRRERSHAAARLFVLESIGYELGMMTSAKKIPGRKPGAATIACPDLLQVLTWIKTRSS